MRESVYDWARTIKQHKREKRKKKYVVIFLFFHKYFWFSAFSFLGVRIHTFLGIWKLAVFALLLRVSVRISVKKRSRNSFISRELKTIVLKKSGIRLAYLMYYIVEYLNMFYTTLSFLFILVYILYSQYTCCLGIFGFFYFFFLFSAQYILLYTYVF